MEVSKAALEYMDTTYAILQRGGPEVSEYKFLKEVPEDISTIPLEDQFNLYEMISPILSTNSMIGFTFQKPHGYAGDFELIDRIYSKWESKDDNLNKWDHFYHDMEGAKAVRNRKSYFSKLINRIEQKHEQALVLNLGSGPCVDLFEFLQTKREHSVRFECLDMDDAAIEYGSTICDNYIDEIKFIKQNALKFDPGYQYDCIWSAGLFDYFNDKLFIRLLRRIYSLVKVGGELVIGNFSTNNPSRAAMELFGKWFLYHRSEETLIDLAQKAGIPRDLIQVSQEEEGVNLFLHLIKE